MEAPFLDLKTPNRALKAEIMACWEEILDTAHFVGGKYLDLFEQEFAKACSVKECIAVSSGTDALKLIFKALELQSGHEVITVPNTFIATTEAISQAGGTIKFVDIDPDTYTIDVSKIEAAITSNTRGIVPVHLYGQMADMDPILDIAKRYDLWIVEDACQAHLAEYKGRRAGSIGRAAAFSFYPGKNLGACGEAGAITTHDRELAQKVRVLRDHGQARKYHHEYEGYNDRCDALQAAALTVKLNHVPQWNEMRRKNAQLYVDHLQQVAGITLPVISKYCLPVFHLFVIQVDNRDRVMTELDKRGVKTGLHYPIPLHLQKAYQHLKIPVGSFPVTEKCAPRLLSLPMYPELTPAQISYVSDCLQEILGSSS
ncbi:DegT/DnrJ/EryC1/StrS family aminotransferase [candidate division CSSED10-310 bacterium]|uniref:DegT/DnrJ/EryC1/StrS family aminotransferase n=1 Tax=candidate division CSSED10-310 bacterium TaxID=2855610 RepID=A0ABV6YUW7_UNCC1